MAQRIVLITGANSGVGYATAEVLAHASEDFHVIMAGRSLEKAKTAMSEIEAGGIKGKLSAVQLDVTDEKSVEQVATYIDQQFGHLDALVNNAGVGSRGDNVKSRMQTCMDTNVVGPAVVSEYMRPLLLKSANPYTVYVSSGVGSIALASDPTSRNYRGLKNGEAYRASKAALNMIAIQESIVYSDTALKVFSMCPGFVRSNLRGQSEEERSGLGNAGDPKDSGQTILSILEGKRDADAGRFIHGTGVYPW